MTTRKNTIGLVRDLAITSDDMRVRRHALDILTAGATLFDTDGPRGDAEREAMRSFVTAGCSDSYEYCDDYGPVVTTAPGWYHVVTCDGARPCYSPADWVM